MKKNKPNQKINKKPLPQKKSKKAKKKNITIQGQPKHRDYVAGARYDSRSSFGAYVVSTNNQDLTDKQVKAFRKRITIKTMRRKFTWRSNPYLQLTKKPSEVRMGKGRGVKINRTVNPLVIGSILCEVDITPYFKRTYQAGLGVYHAFVRAARKLPPTYRVFRGDL